MAIKLSLEKILARIKLMILVQFHFDCGKTMFKTWFLIYKKNTNPMANCQILCRIKGIGYICHLDMNNLKNHVRLKHLIRDT